MHTQNKYYLGMTVLSSCNRSTMQDNPFQNTQLLVMHAYSTLQFGRLMA